MSKVNYTDKATAMVWELEIPQVEEIKGLYEELLEQHPQTGEGFPLAVLYMAGYINGKMEQEQEPPNQMIAINDLVSELDNILDQLHYSADGIERFFCREYESNNLLAYSLERERPLAQINFGLIVKARKIADELLAKTTPN